MTSSSVPLNHMIRLSLKYSKLHKLKYQFYICTLGRNTAKQKYIKVVYTSPPHLKKNFYRKATKWIWFSISTSLHLILLAYNLSSKKLFWRSSEELQCKCRNYDFFLWTIIINCFTLSAGACVYFSISPSITWHGLLITNGTCLLTLQQLHGQSNWHEIPAHPMAPQWYRKS